MEETKVKKNNMNAYEKFKDKFFNFHNYPARRKFYNSSWSILLGIIIMMLSIAIFQYNPFEVLLSFVENSNKNSLFIPTIATYIFAALSIAICFKAGIFNIGVPGQMMISGFIMLVILKNQEVNNGSITTENVFLAIFVGILTSIVCSLVLAVLKTYLRVNEVVASIMLNWIIFFIIRYIVGINVDTGLELSTTTDWSLNQTSSFLTPSFFYIDSSAWTKSSWAWILIIISVLVSALLWVVIRFTKFGYKIKMVGLSKTASEYSGTNKNNLTLITLSISGLFSGIAGAIWYIGLNGQMNISITSGPTLVGFNAIAISLIVFDNPIAIILSSVMFSIVSVGSNNLTLFFPLLPTEMTDVVSGIFIYSAALAFLFTKFVPFEWTRNFIILVRYKTYREKYWQNYKEFFIYHSSWFKEKKQLFSLWYDNHSAWSSIFKKYKEIQKKEEINIVENNTEFRDNNKFKFNKLSNDEKIKYLDFLSKLKKERDIELAKENYFEKDKIKSIRIARYTNWKHLYLDMKTEIIKSHLHIVDEKLVDTTSEISSKEKERLDKKKKQKGGGK